MGGHDICDGEEAFKKIKDKFSNTTDSKPIKILDIPDDYNFMDEEQIEILKSRVSEYIEVPE